MILNIIFAIKNLYKCNENHWHEIGSFKHLFEVIAAPVNAQITENQRVKQLNIPFFPYLTVFKIVAPIAHRGANIQNIISCCWNVAPHQYTSMIPKFTFDAAIIQPK